MVEENESEAQDDVKKISSEIKSIDGLVKRFLEYCEIDRGHSPLTISNYRHYLVRFTDFCDGAHITKPGDITQEVVHRYRLWLNRLTPDQLSTAKSSTAHDQNDKNSQYISSSEVSSESTKEGGGLSRTTQNYHLIALRSFLKFVARQDIPSLPADRIELADTPDRQISFLDADEVTRLLKAPKPTTLMGARDSAILGLLFSTGLRVAELTNLNRDQINLKTDELTVVGKGGKARLVFVSELSRDLLANYLKRRKDRDPALFVRHGKKAIAAAKIKEKTDYTLRVDGSAVSQLRLTPRTIQRIVKKYAKQVGITKEVHPHTLRHSFATDLLGNGADIRSVQQLLGHSSITTTQLYTHVTNKQLRDVHRKFHGKKDTNE